MAALSADLDTRIPLIGTEGPFGPDWNAIYKSRDQAYRDYLQQQDIAGQNALRGVFGNQNALNSAGLPTPQGLAPVFKADPKLGFDIASAVQNLQYNQQRTLGANLLENQRINKIYDEAVGGPIATYMQDLKLKGISEDQQDTLVKQRYKQLMDDMQKANGFTDSTMARWPSQADPLSGMRSEMFRKRDEDISKRWHDHVDSMGRPYTTNDYYPGVTFSQDRSGPANFVPMGVRRDASEKIEERVEVKPDGTRVNILYDPLNQGYLKDNKPYQPGSDSTIERIGISKTPTASKSQKPTEIRVKKLDEAGNITEDTEVIPVQLLSNKPGEPVNYQDARTGKPIDPARLVQTNLSPSESSRLPLSQAAREMQVGQMLAGDYSMLQSAWRDPNRRTELMNDLAAEKDRLWGFHPTDAEKENSTPEQLRSMEREARKNLGEQAAATTAMFKANQSALGSLVKLKSNVENFEKTALKNANLVEDLLDKGGPWSTSPLMNQGLNFVRRQFKGDKDLLALDNAITALKNEYAKIMSNPGATGAVTSDHARAEADTLINSKQSVEGIKSAIATMREEMANRISSINEQIGSTISSIESGEGIRRPFTKESPEATKTSGPQQGPPVTPRESSASATIPPFKPVQSGIESLDKAIKQLPQNDNQVHRVMDNAKHIEHFILNGKEISREEAVRLIGR